MKFSKSQVLTFLRDGGGSMDWHPFVETGSLGFLKELKDDGLVTKAPYVLLDSNHSIKYEYHYIEYEYEYEYDYDYEYD